jgi:hypothetical protein
VAERQYTGPAFASPSRIFSYAGMRIPTRPGLAQSGVVPITRSNPGVQNTDWFGGSIASQSSCVVVANEAKFKDGVGEMLTAASQMFTGSIREKSK